MAYGTTAGVAARIPGIGASVLSTPDTDQIAAWLTQGSAMLDRVLSMAGYAAPVANTAALWPELAALAEQYAAAHALRARGLDSLTGEGEARSDVWLREVREAIKAMAAGDLSGVGVSLTDAPTVRRRGIRSTQLRRIDGYSATYEGTEYPYLHPSE